MFYNCTIQMGNKVSSNITYIYMLQDGIIGRFREVWKMDQICYFNSYWPISP